VAEGRFASRLGLVLSAVCKPTRLESAVSMSVLVPTNLCGDVDSYFCRARKTGLLSETH
jgi:hypothetical protein